LYQIRKRPKNALNEVFHFNYIPFWEGFEGLCFKVGQVLINQQLQKEDNKRVV
jgi:hypothetical protein